MDKLTKEEVLHIAELGKLNLKDEEIENYSYQLKALLNEINKVTKINLTEEEILISPSENKCNTREDKEIDCDEKKELINNAPKKFDKFIEVVGVFDE